MKIEEKSINTSYAQERLDYIDSQISKAYRPPVPAGTRRTYNGHAYIKTVEGKWESAGSVVDFDEDKDKKKKKKKPVKPKKVPKDKVETAPYK